MYQCKKAFSLIELMVVIAIVAILAVVAVPAYQAYIVKSKSASAMLALSAFGDQVKEYFTMHGVAPTSVTQVGYSEGIIPTETPRPTDKADFIAPPNVVTFGLSGSGNGSGNTCPFFTVYEYVTDVIAPFGAGMDGTNTFQITSFYYDINGTYERACFISPFGNGNQSVIANIKIPGCNTQGPDTAAHLARLAELNTAICN